MCKVELILGFCDTHLISEIFLDKIKEYQRNWLQHINRILRNRLPRILKKTLQKNGQKKPREIIKEISRRVRMERVNNWSISMLAR
jgi:hypothetical protein